MFTINVKENNAVKKYICSSAKAVAAKMSELALWTKDVQISWGDDVYGTAYGQRFSGFCLIEKGDKCYV